MARASYPTSASGLRPARSVRPYNDDQQRASTLAAGAAPYSYQQNQPVLVRCRPHTWVAGTVVQGPAFSVLFQGRVVEVNYRQVNGSIARGYFPEADVRPVQ
ncbi:hypothetical protein GY45DRAFT_1321693 [Cubamyces sp. BRFM 1775]|nr:hypothetical protein GY45DRAFT_1321693 [Cubamyces sp. BRFM 1775]